MHPDSIATKPEVSFHAKWLLTDTSDLTALAIRGANAANGRLPGRKIEPEWNDPILILEMLDGPQPPLSERYYLEYPLPTAFLFRSAYLSTPKLPSVVADGFQYGVSQHIPRNDEEREAWQPLQFAVRCYILTFLLLLVSLFFVLGFGYQSGDSWNRWVWILALPGCCYFTLHRFDIAPTLATALAFFALGRRRVAWAGAFLGLGVILKIFPLLLAPVIFRFLGIRKGIYFSIAFGATVALGFGMAWALTDWTSLIGPIQVQLSRPLEVGWTLYGKLIPLTIGENSPLRLGILTAIILGCCFTRPPDLEAVLRRCGIILASFVVLAVFWSPQWFIWFLPILIPLGLRTRRFAIAAIVLDLMNYFSFPLVFWIFPSYCPAEWFEPLAVGTTFFRGAVWIGLAILFAIRRPCDPKKSLDASLPKIAATIIDDGNRRGIPKGLKWVRCEWGGQPIVNDPLAFVPFNVSFEPIPGSEMEDVPAARIPRPVTAVLRRVKGEWQLDRPPVFNLTLEGVAKRVKE